jgi:hypothetical protein
VLQPASVKKSHVNLMQQSLECGGKVPEEEAGVEDLVDGDEAGMAHDVGRFGENDARGLLRFLQDKSQMSSFLRFFLR